MQISMSDCKTILFTFLIVVMVLTFSGMNTAQAQQSDVKINYNTPNQNLIVEYSFNETNCSVGAFNSQFGALNVGTTFDSNFIPKLYTIGANSIITNGYEEISCEGSLTIPLHRLFTNSNNSLLFLLEFFSDDGNTFLDKFAFNYNKIHPSLENTEFDSCKSSVLSRVNVSQILFVNNTKVTLYKLPACNAETLDSSYTIPSTNSAIKKKSGGCSGDCTPPTFYKNQDGVPIVKDGFEFKGNPTNVTNYHTEYPLITVNTNQTYNMKVKVYENNALRWIQVGFGIPEVGVPLNEAESLVTFHLNSTSIEEIETVDKSTLIDIVSSTLNIVPCGYVESQCDELDFDFTFRDELKNNVVAINAVDQSRNGVTRYMNDGIEVIGESMNVPLESKVSVSNGGVFYPQERGTVTLTLVDYKTDSWQDEYGYLWTSDNYESFRIVDTIPVPQRTPDLEWAAMTRMNSNFVVLVQNEQDKAQIILDDYCPHCNDTPFVEIQNVVLSENTIRLDRADNQELQRAIILEQHRAQLILDNN